MRKILDKIKKIFTNDNQVELPIKKVELPMKKEELRAFNWTPKIYKLIKPIPGLFIGARFQQTYQSDLVYFHGIPVDDRKSEKDQVGIIEFEAQYVENNPEWFEELI